MSKPKLTYFDAPVSRGEECRLALHLAGVDFDDVRIKSADWPGIKAQTPYGGLPMLELPGKAALAHSNAILVLIGRRHGLHPADDFEAARHEGMMQHVEDLRAVVSPTGLSSAAQKSTSSTSRSTWPCAGSTAARSITFRLRYSPAIPGWSACTTQCVTTPA